MLRDKEALARFNTDINDLQKIINEELGTAQMAIDKAVQSIMRLDNNDMNAMKNASLSPKGMDFVLEAIITIFDIHLKPEEKFWENAVRLIIDEFREFF